MGLDIVEPFCAVEAEFDIDFSDEEAEQARTVGQLYALVLEKCDLPRRPHSGPVESVRGASSLNRFPDAEQGVWGALLDLICDQTAVKRDQLRREARFVEDLQPS